MTLMRLDGVVMKEILKLKELQMPVMMTSIIII